MDEESAHVLAVGQVFDGLSRRWLLPPCLQQWHGVLWLTDPRLDSQNVEARTAADALMPKRGVARNGTALRARHLGG